MRRTVHSPRPGRSRKSATAHQPTDGGHQLGGLIVALLRRIGADHTVMGVAVEEAECHLVEGSLSSADLGQDVDAVAVLLNHAFDAPNLSLDPAQASEELVLGRGVSACRCVCHDEIIPLPPRGIILILMNDLLDVVWHGVKDAFLMAWEVWWALVLGFAISAIVQAWVPRERVERALSGNGPRPVAWATGLGAASSSCSYAAIAIAKSLFQKGASAVSALAFQFASTNLVWELGLVLWVLIGWQFTVAEYVGGIVMIVLMAVLLRLFVSRSLERAARAHAVAADTGHQHHAAGSELSWRQRLTSPAAWSDVAHNFRGDWQMLWKEISIGFLLAGFVAQFGNGFFESLFVHNASEPIPTIENVVIGPVIAVLSFVCSVGNVHLGAVLWSGGISFAGVLAFLFADLIVLPILAIYRKYYGLSFTIRITALMFVTMVLAGLLINALFSALGAIPSGPRPSRADIFGSLQVNYKLFLNVLGLAIFVTMFWITRRSGATDPMCGMSVDRAKALQKEVAGKTYYFCSQRCMRAFEGDERQRHAGHAHAQ
jgi:uncharacterized membrane protein YraQ (UPF0718 family)/YHS domain-containing protein